MIYETPVLETDRLILKRGNNLDYQKVYEYDLSKLRNIAGEFVFEKYDTSKLVGVEIPYENSFDWIVYLKEGMIPISNVVADRQRKDLNSIELAFNTHPNYWKMGYTTEAIDTIIKFLFDFGYDNIVCGYDEGNIKSKNLNLKFRFEPLETIDGAWIKNGIPVRSYKMILSKEKYATLHKSIIK